ARERGARGRARGVKQSASGGRAGGVQPASPIPTPTRHISRIQKAPMVIEPMVTSVARPQSAVIRDHRATQTVMIQTRLATSAKRVSGIPTVVRSEEHTSELQSCE